MIDRPDLVRRLEDSLGFARRTLHHADRTHPSWAVDLGQVSGYEKMLLEASLLAMVVARDPHCREEAAELAADIRAIYDSRDTISVLMRRPWSATTLGTTILALDGFGLATALERSALDRAWQSPFVECNERVPFRLLDREWVKHLAGRGDLAGQGPLVALSAAGRANHPVYMSREDAYAITHTIMYATDFGVLAPPAGLAGPELAECIDAALVWCLAAGDFDLVAELLLAQLFVHRGLSEYGGVAWRVTAHTWDELGFLPSPSLSAETMGELDDDHELEQYAFQQMYHTMFVGGLLCNALLSTGAGEASAPAPRRWSDWFTPVRHAVRRARAAATRFAGGAEVGLGDWVADDRRIDELAARWLGAGDGSLDEAVVLRMATDAWCIESARANDLLGLAAGLRRASTLRAASVTDCVGSTFIADQSLPSGAIGASLLDDELAGWCDDGRRSTAATVAAVLASVLAAVDERDGTEVDRRVA